MYVCISAKHLTAMPTTANPLSQDAFAPSRACRYEPKGGTHCRARAQIGGEFCFFHDPTLGNARAAARKAGGIARTLRVALPANLPNKRLRTASEVVDLLGETINQVRLGELDLRVSNAIGYLSGILLSAIEKGSYEERLSALEAAVASPSHATKLPFDEDCSFEFAQTGAGETCPK
jgi:hypothetical protein